MGAAGGRKEVCRAVSDKDDVTSRKQREEQGIELDLGLLLAKVPPSCLLLSHLRMSLRSLTL